MKKPTSTSNAASAAAALGLALFRACPCGASFNSNDAGASGAAFLGLPTSPRASAMGGAFVAVPGDAADLDYNPAGLADVDAPTLSAMHHEYLGAFRQDAAAYVHPLAGGGALAAGTDILSQSPIDKVDNAGTATGGSFAPLDLAAKAGYGRRWGRLSLGAAAGVVQQRIDGAQASAFAADAGGLWRAPWRDVTVGAAVTSLGTKIGFADKAPLPATLRAGVSFRPAPALLQCLEADLPLAGAPSARAGMEYDAEAGGIGVALRGGFETTAARDLGALAGFSAGVGLSYHALRLDLAFAPFGDLGASYRMGATWRFGQGQRRGPGMKPQTGRGAAGTRGDLEAHRGIGDGDDFDYLNLDNKALFGR